MIPVAPVPEPPDFDTKARQPGRVWLAAHPDAKRPRDLWSRFRPALADGFGDRCGYGAMYEPVGTVDHHLSFARSPALAYEWSNYRFVSQWINASKREGLITLDGLREVAPLIAAAVEREAG